MDPAYIVEAAEAYAKGLNLEDEEFAFSLSDFIAGAKWMQERMEEIKLTENR